MSQLIEKLKTALAFDENVELRESHAHSNSSGVIEQIRCLDSESKIIWYAGHHNGFHASAKESSVRLADIHSALIQVVNAAQGCSDGNCRLRDRDGGMHTNGGCHCKREVQDALANVRSILGG